MDSNAQQVLRSAVLVFAGLVLGRFLQYVVKAVLARWLTPSLYGQYVQGMAVAEFAAVVAILGLTMTIPRLLSYRELDVSGGTLVLSAAVISLLGGIIMTGVLWIGAPVIASLFGDPQMERILRLFTVLIVPIALYEVAVSVIRGVEETRSKVIIQDLVVPVLHLILVGGGVVLGLGVGAMIGAWLVATLAGLVAAVVVVRRIPSIDLSGARFRPGPLVTFATPLLLVSVLFVVNRWIDVVMVGYFMPAASTGIYEIALAAAGLVGMVRSSMAYLFLPRASALLAEDAVFELEALYRRVARWTMLLTIPVAGSFIVAPERLLGLLFGEAYTAGAGVLVVLTAAYFIMSIEGPSDMTLLAAGDRWRLLAVTASLAVIDAVANWLLIPRYGIMGAAGGMAIGIVAANLLAIVFVYRRTGIHPYTGRYLRALVSGILVYLPLALLPMPGIIRTLALLFAGGLAYVVVLWLTAAIDREDITQIRGLMD